MHLENFSETQISIQNEHINAIFTYNLYLNFQKGILRPNLLDGRGVKSLLSNGIFWDVMLIIIMLIQFKIAHGIRHKYNQADRKGDWFYCLPNHH